MTSAGILIIEDETDIRETLQQLFEMEGYAVSCAENGAEGLAKFAEMERPCVILLDLLMPVMNGWKFLEERQRDPALASVPVVVLSGVAEKPKDLGEATVFFRKPVKFDLLLAVVSEKCGARQEAG